MNDSLIQYYRCPERYVRLARRGSPADASGYFRFGESTICYGRCCAGRPSASPVGTLYDGYPEASVEMGTTFLPFDVAEVVKNLRYELYSDFASDRKSTLERAVIGTYYLLRPLLPVAVRKHLQRARLNDWREIPFPHWPVDRTVDNLFEQLLLLSLRAQGVDRIPFIWFWPDGAPGCAIITHDVETTQGRDFCGTVMDIDDAYDIKASFQVVPERRYEVTPGYLDSITRRGFEVAVQDLNHDGHLYRDRKQFRERVAKINEYGGLWGAKGFRAAVLYRRQEWYDDLNFAYDMSVPNVAHLDPQRGGCCTVMPYFIGNILELPVTTTQDYSLFHILKDHSINLWKQQIDLIMEKHGLINVIIHPDYITAPRERKTFEELLGYLDKMRSEKSLWTALPNDVNSWWRQRAEMQLIEDANGLRIEGAGKERARIAYASEKDGRLVVTIQEGPTDKGLGTSKHPVQKVGLAKDRDRFCK